MPTSGVLAGAATPKLVIASSATGLQAATMLSAAARSASQIPSAVTRRGTVRADWPHRMKSCAEPRSSAAANSHWTVVQSIQRVQPAACRHAARLSALQTQSAANWGGTTRALARRCSSPSAVVFAPAVISVLATVARHTRCQVVAIRSAAQPSAQPMHIAVRRHGMSPVLQWLDRSARTLQRAPARVRSAENQTLATVAFLI